MKNFDKAFQKKERKIYKYKHFSTKCFLLIPLMWLAALEEKLRDAHYDAITWSDSRTNKIISYTFPKFAEVNKEKKEIGSYIRSWNFYWKGWAHIWDKTYCKKFNREISAYLINNYQMPNYVKIVEKDDASGEWTWVAFQSLKYNIYVDR